MLFCDYTGLFYRHPCPNIMYKALLRIQLALLRIRSALLRLHRASLRRHLLRYTPSNNTVYLELLWFSFARMRMALFCGYVKPRCGYAGLFCGDTCIDTFSHESYTHPHKHTRIHTHTHTIAMLCVCAYVQGSFADTLALLQSNAYT